MKLSNLIDSLEKLTARLRYGCGNHGCVIYNPKGMGTNMICKCYPREIAAKLLNLAAELELDSVLNKNKWEK